MAATCAWCGSADVQALTDRYQCLIDGKWTGMDGKKYDKPGPYNTDEAASPAVDPYDDKLGNLQDERLREKST